MSDSINADQKQGGINSENLDYLRAVLAMNPIWDAPEILHRRRKALRLEASNAQSTVEFDKYEREATLLRGRSLIQSLRREFDRISPDEFESQLLMLTGNSLPELAPAISRLKTAFNNRDKLRELQKNPKFSSLLIGTLIKSFSTSDAEWRILRENYLGSLTSRSMVSKAQRTAQYLSTNHPEIFAIERNWLTDVLRKKGVTIQYFSITNGIAMLFILWVVSSLISILIEFAK